ncbi:MAG: SDR family oxidoreductase [Rhodobacteraceae bacterium]|nr:SDR family oxidoreductase [Paracoccaceae bacterium]
MAKTIIITGAGSGIGAITASRFLGAGWNVALFGRREEPLKKIAANHPQALVLPCDVVDETAVDAAFDKVITRFGHLDTLFNNAGIGVFGGSIDELSVADWRACIDINLTGSFICARAAFGVMRGQTPMGGRIINNGSISAYAPRPGSAPYTASKFAITGLTKTIALDGRPYDITCGQIDIGNAGTEMTERMAEGIIQADGSIRGEPTMDVENVGNAVLQMAELPLEVNVLNMTLMASKMPFVGRG